MTAKRTIATAAWSGCPMPLLSRATATRQGPSPAADRRRSAPREEEGERAAPGLGRILQVREVKGRDVTGPAVAVRG